MSVAYLGFCSHLHRSHMRKDIYHRQVAVVERGSRGRLVPGDKRANGMRWDHQTAALKQNISISFEGASAEESRLGSRGPQARGWFEVWEGNEAVSQADVGTRPRVWISDLLCSQGKSQEKWGCSKFCPRSHRDDRAERHFWSAFLLFSLSFLYYCQYG